jgi:hypothetical protein
LVGMLYSVAHRDEQFQPFSRGEVVLVTVLCDGHALGRPKMMPAIWPK